MFIFRFISDIFRAIQAPFRGFTMFLRANPLTRAFGMARSMRGRFNQALSVPSRQIKRMLPKQFRVASPAGETDSDRELPPEEAARRGGRRRAQRGRRVRSARRIDFTQVHLVSANSQRQILHIGSTVGTSSTELILKTGPRRAVRLQFAKVDERVVGAPLAVTLLAASRDVTLMVDNQQAQPTAPFQNGSRLNVDGQNYTIELYAGGSLPAVTRVDAAWGTNVGPRRDVNQDAVGIYQHPSAYMFTIADGVGGGYAGDEVSEYAVKYLQSVFKRNIDYENLSWYDIYQTAYSYINQEVRNWVQQAPQPAGTTLTSIFIRSWTAYIAHVGDSRLYLLRDGQLRLLTTDHNDEVEVETRNRAGYPVTVTRSILARAIGRSDTISPDVMTIPLQPKDRLLMATDGVTNNVEDAEIHQLLAENALATIPDALIQLANGRDNNDNASVIALEVMQESYERDIWLAEPEDRVYVGGPRWFLRLRSPANMNTIYSFITGTGCLLLLVAAFTLGVIWSVQTVQNTFFSADPAVSINVAPESAANQDAAAPTRTSEGPLGRLFGGSLPTDAATATPSPRPTATALPTQTPPPTFTPLPTTTPFTHQLTTDVPSPLPPTSTVRPGR